MKQIEKLENFMSLKRGLNNADVQELEDLLYPQGISRTVTADDIHDIENKLGVLLPDCYVKFLFEYGYASWFGGSIYGITEHGCTEPGLDLSVVSINESVKMNKSRNLKKLMENCIAISTDDAGGYIIMDCSKSSNAGNIKYIADEGGWLIVQEWRDLIDLIDDKIANAEQSN